MVDDIGGDSNCSTSLWIVNFAPHEDATAFDRQIDRSAAIRAENGDLPLLQSLQDLGVRMPEEIPAAARNHRKTW
jgi:hypothetical protein